MKTKLCFWLCGCLLSASAFSQSLQLHYDLGKDRQYLTSTIEMFRPDSLGSTFFFVDFDYDGGKGNTMSLSYFEIARYFTLPLLDHKLDATLQFNDGHAVFDGAAVPLGQIWLAGLSYPVKLRNFEVKMDILYRHADYSSGAGFQYTAAWFHPFCEERFLFSGFLDIWTEDRGEGNNVVWMAEPQLWWNAWDKLFLGSELEISRNFISSDRWEFMPTAGVQWFF